MKLKKIEWKDVPYNGAEPSPESSTGFIGKLQAVYIENTAPEKYDYYLLFSPNGEFDGSATTLTKAKRAAESALTDFFESIIEKE